MIGRKFILLDEVDSTNNYAATLLAEGKLAHGTVILAEKQTAGRGQRGNSWSSTAGNQFACSVYVETAFLSAAHYLHLNIAVALALRNTIQAFTSDQVYVKWPNDLLVNDRKLAGILIEAQWQQGKMNGAIIGVGINRIREEGLPSGCALEQLMVVVPGIQQLAQEFAIQLEQQFQRLKNQDWNALWEDYHAHLWRRMEETQLQTPEGVLFIGTILGVEPDGNIRVQTEDGIRSYGLQEVKFIY